MISAVADGYGKRKTKVIEEMGLELPDS